MEIKYATPSECGRLFTDDEWPCLVPKADESDQVMVGVTLKALTSIFPMVSTMTAVHEIIDKAPPGKKDLLLSLEVPEVAGGKPIFFGIKCESCHPKVIYTL